MNSEGSLEILKTRFIPDAFHEHWIQDQWFQQDRDPTHSIGDVPDFLRSHYDHRNDVSLQDTSRIALGMNFFERPIAMTYYH